MESRKIVRLISSVLISIALWVYVINVVNPSSTTTVRNIPVTLTGTETLYEKNLAIVGSGSYTVDITVRASRTDLSTLSVDNITATADVSGLTLGQDYITVDVSVPREYTVEDIRTRKIQVYVDELDFKTAKVNVIFEGTPSGNYEATVVSLYPSTVQVYGAKRLVENVDDVFVTIDASKLEYESVTESVLRGTVRDSSGNVLQGVETAEQDITVAVASYSTKPVALKTSYYGDPWAGVTINNISAPETITIKGASANLSAVSEIYSQDIDIDGVYEDTSVDIVPILPEGIFVSDKSKDLKLSIDLADTGSIEFYYYPYEINTTGLSESLRASYSLGDGSYIIATVTGPVTTLKTMSASDIVITADGSKFTTSTKTARITAGTQITGVNISLSTQTVSVNVEEK